MNKSVLMLGMFFGSAVGGYIPVIFGASMFSIYSIILTAIGGILGIWLAYRIQE